MDIISKTKKMFVRNRDIIKLTAGQIATVEKMEKDRQTILEAMNKNQNEIKNYMMAILDEKGDPNSTYKLDYENRRLVRNGFESPIDKMVHNKPEKVEAIKK